MEMLPFVSFDDSIMCVATGSRNSELDSDVTWEALCVWGR